MQILYLNVYVANDNIVCVRECEENIGVSLNVLGLGGLPAINLSIDE